jgi:ferrous iron transport protein B
VLAAATRSRREIEADIGIEAGLALAERRYDFVRRMAEDVTGGLGRGPVWSDRADRVLTHPIMGLPVFLAVMWAVLKITADVTAPFLDWVDGVVSGPLSRWAVSGLSNVGLDGGWVEGL